MKLSDKMPIAVTVLLAVAVIAVGATQASQQTSAGSIQVFGAAPELAQNGARLRSEVETFLHMVRSL